MLTAKAETVDRIVGLEIGADDYVVKPFDPRELLARIGAVLRRHGGRVLPDAPGHSSSVYSFGPFELDVDRRRLTKSGHVIVLTKGEFAVLEVLSSHPRQPLSRERLFSLSRRRSFVIADRSMDIQISRLRRLIEVDVSRPCYIQTVWGFGYVFVPEGDAQ
jgi:two-component system phosphate regulon response regulator OmpR